MLPSPNEALAVQRAECAARLEQHLAAGDAPITELRELQDRLRLFDSVLAERQGVQDRRPSRVFAPMLLVAAVLTLAAVLPVPMVPVSLELRATSMALTLVDAAALGPIALAGDSRIEGVTALESPDASLSRAFAAERADTLTLHGADAQLRTLQLPAGARLTIRAERDAVLLQVESPREPTQAEFELRGNTAFRFGEAARSEERTYDHGEWLRLRAGDPQRQSAVPPPLVLSLGRAANSSARLTKLRPATLRFADRSDSGGAVAGVSSSLEGGTLTLAATAETVALAAGDWLEIDGLVVERCEVELGSPLVLKLNGSARGLQLRVGDFARSLKPSWLEYTARHHLVQLLWSSVAVLWGAWAWTRKQFAAAH